ncbi:hypothetical protein [Leifsonia sp. PS1209]|uniref:hypothetical protein n=1 Tax=Leifsonia sp. PS1209 TaxID=2724914 RepID=UPI001FFB0036|nr:hypothetical protein [Leifsonia sp. PS1209]
MIEMQTMVRTTIAINGTGYFLAQGQDIEDLQNRIEAAAASSGRFVSFTVVGNRAVSVLITPRSQAVISVETVQFDPRDTGDDEEPFGGLFDF